MAKYKFTTELSADGIKDLRKWLNDYRNNELPNKLQKFVKKLAEIGIPVIEKQIDEASYSYDKKWVRSGSDTEHQTYIEITSLRESALATLVLQGKEILFIEFGAGISLNPSPGVGGSPHPMGSQYGFLIGTYGHGYGSRKVWGYYSETGELILTKGTEATMPMHMADLEIIDNVKRVAKEVFK